MAKQQTEPKSERVLVSLKESERQRLDRLASVTGRSRSEEARQLILMGMDDAEKMVDHPIISKVVALGLGVMELTGNAEASKAKKVLREFKMNEKRSRQKRGGAE